MLRRSTTESLANLGRRNQNLLRRQLGFITSLEREESDPTGLANLFELDHLATRMRRNAESLLVLVGAASPRQWSEPLAIADVIRAAVSEVEEYRRVVAAPGRRRAWSPARWSAGSRTCWPSWWRTAWPSPRRTWTWRSRAGWIGDSYLIAITDQGIGMNPADLELANSASARRGRLHRRADPLPRPLRGRPARHRHGHQRPAAPSPVTGVTARIVLPPSLLAGDRAVTAPPRPPRVAEPQPSRRGPGVSEPAITQVLTLPPAATGAGRPDPGDHHRVRHGGGTLRRRPGGERVRPSRRCRDGSDRTPNGLRRREPQGRAGPRHPPRPPRSPSVRAPVGDSPERGTRQIERLPQRHAARQ